LYPNSNYARILYLLALWGLAWSLSWVRSTHQTNSTDNPRDLIYARGKVIVTVPVQTIQRFPPGPSPRELLPKIRKIQSDAPGFLLELSQQYGDLSYFPVGKQPVYIISHPDGVKHVLQDQHRRYSKDTVQYNALATITGRGLLTSDGPFWLRQRRLAQPAFARPRLMALDRSLRRPPAPC
jgi:hypothetical protein